MNKKQIIDVSNSENIEIKTTSKNNSKIKKNKNKLLVAIISLIILISIATIILIIFINNHNEKKEKEYKNLMISTAKEIYLLEIAAEYHSAYIIQVWYNAIFKERNYSTDIYTYPEDAYGYGVKMWVDFKTAINNYLTTNAEELQKLKNEESKIKTKLNELQNIPNEEYKNSLDILMEIYSNFNTMVSLSTNPTGTYKEYGEKCRDYQNQFESAYNKLLIIFPEIQLESN